MKAVRAIYEHGVFRPLEPVELPEASEVVLFPQAAPAFAPVSADEEAELRDILAERYQGDRDDTARHDEHRP